jgi:hypothetical protein
MSFVNSEPLPFTYRPISPGFIRLLIPDPIGKHGDHSWTLQVASISDTDLSFDALSYAWGTQTELLPLPGARKQNSFQ